MTERLHRLIKSASDIYTYREIADITGFSTGKAARWAKLDFAEAQYGWKEEDDTHFDLLSEALQGLKDEPSNPGEERSVETLADGRKVIEGTVGGRIPSQKEVLDRFGIDLGLFEVKSQRVVEKTTEMKLKRYKVNEESGAVHTYEEPHSHLGYSVRFELKPRVDALVRIQALDNLLDRMESGNWRWPKRDARVKVDGGHALVFNIQDLHLGKMAYDEGWSIDDAKREHKAVIDRILDYTDLSTIDKFIYVFGGDYTQADSPRGQTTSGTQVENSTLWENQYEAGLDLLIQTLTYLAALKPVEAHLVRGNHPWNTEYTMAVAAERLFRMHPDIEVFPWKSGKAPIVYGENFILATHGDNAPPERAILAIANEYREEWGNSSFCEVLSGHLHHRKGQVILFEERGKVVWRQCGSLSQTDPWHRIKSFEGGLRTAEAHMYSASNGYVATFNANA